MLQPHTEQQQKLIARGGESAARSSSDGAYRVKQGSYANPTPGRIARNILTHSHTCSDQRAYKKAAQEIGVHAHGASYPLSLAKFLVQFLTEKGDLVIDPMAGSMTTAKAAQELGRRWIASDIVYDYVRGAAQRFRECEDFALAL